MNDGLELAASFSLPPNQKGLCGPGRVDWKDKKKLAATMRQFRAPYAYMSLIGEANGLEPFDYEVVEAFWIGNKMLSRVERDEAAAMICRRFVGPGLLSPKRALTLVSALPRKVYPHHSFHVFYIGSISGVLKRTRTQMDACRVAWGKIGSVGRTSVGVKYRPLELKENGKRKENGEGRKTACLSPRLSSARWAFDSSRFSPAPGEVAASHWGVLAARLDKRQEKNLEKYTRINVGLFGKRPKEED
ncbi:Uncharacterised protein [uncultured archaeon]|nr:Uncharacterised protein [uncultured archaeon]